MSSFVYALQSGRNGRYCTGFSSDPEVRLIEHNAGKVRATRHLSSLDIGLPGRMPGRDISPQARVSDEGDEESGVSGETDRQGS